MHVPYRKMHGTGNLILVVDQRFDSAVPPSAKKIRELGDEDTGPGFDQMMWLTAATDGSSVTSYRVFNRDGSEVEQCGNGARCVAKYLFEKDFLHDSFTLQSPSETLPVRISPDGQVAVSMGKPIFEPDEIPFVADHRDKHYRLEVDDHILQVSALSMGNPHCVVTVADVATAPVIELGAKLERHERFPERCNAGFMQIIDRENIALRVFERGVGETAACGTGASAAVVAGQQLALLDEVVNVHLPGGQLVISWRGGNSPVWLKGDAELINDGQLDLQE